MKNLITKIVSILIVVLLIIGGIMVMKKAKQRDAAAPVAKAYPILVSTVRMEIKQVELTLPYLAEVKNDQDVTLASKTSSRIEYLKQSGSSVIKGEVIVRLDNTSIQSNMQSNQSQLLAQKITLKYLNATHKRTLELLAVKGASREQSEIEETKIADAESKIDAFNQNKNDLTNSLTYTSITSPISGVISKTMVNMGDMSMPGQPIAIISSRSGSYLKLSVPVSLKVYGVIKNNKTNTALSLNSTFNSLAEYKVHIDNLNLLSGERVEVAVVVYTGKAIKVPFDAILNRNSKSYVFIKENEKAVAKEINIIQTGEDGVVISNNELDGKDIILAKQDILLNLLSGISVNLKVKED